MKFRKFGKLDWKSSVLGFGLENLPLDDEAECVNMLRYGIENGINFVDAGNLFASGNKEKLAEILREVLGGGSRGKLKIAAAIPAAAINSSDDFDKNLDKILSWLQADSIDFLSLGGLDRFTWPKLEEKGVLKRAGKALADKKIGCLGFFFHDQYRFLRDIITAYDNWTFCRFQYSFMDIDHHPGSSGLKYAADNGLAVVVSRPLLGGRLTKNIPESVAKIWAEAKPKRPPAEWALRWVWNHPEAATVVCDMSTMEQVKENMALADKVKAESFTVPEELVISRARDAYRALKPIPCTACRGCMPCPQDIDVPRIFEIYNDALMYGDIETAREIYRLEHHNLESCNECESCAAACGKSIPIPEWLKKARKLLEE
jgi:predicted aldo/keto reductase-like oxidoreductase